MGILEFMSRKGQDRLEDAVGYIKELSDFRKNGDETISVNEEQALIRYANDLMQQMLLKKKGDDQFAEVYASHAYNDFRWIGDRFGDSGKMHATGVWRLVINK